MTGNAEGLMKNIILILFFMFSTRFVMAQVTEDGNDSIFYADQKLMLLRYSMQEIAAANYHVNHLRTTPLIVRLKTNKRQIKAYRDAGKTQTAEAIEDKSLKLNLRIISACIKYFNYCPIYFLDTEDKELFQRTDSLKLSSLISEKDTFIVIPHESVYYLDFGILYGRARTNEWKYKEYRKTEESANKIAEDVFVIRNSKSEQLSAPMPFSALVFFKGSDKLEDIAYPLDNYIELNSINSNSIIKKDLHKIDPVDAAIIRMNDRLTRYYAGITDQQSLMYDVESWYKNNPNKYLYPLWIKIEKKLLSIQDKYPQFTK